MSTPNPSIRKLFCLTLVTAAIGFGLNSLVLTPIYIDLVSNISYQNAWWIDILYYLTDGGLLSLAVYAICYPATLYAIWQVGVKKSLHIPLTFTGLTLLRFVINFGVDSITSGALPDMEEFLMFDLPMLLVMFLLEMVQYVLVIAIAGIIRRRYQTRVSIAEGMKLLPASKRIDYPMPTPAFPFTRLVSLKNPLQCVSFLSALVLFVGRAGMHLIYQITLYQNFGSSDGWIVMLTDLVTDIIIAVLFYFVHLLLLPKFHKQDPAEPVTAE